MRHVGHAVSECGHMKDGTMFVKRYEVGAGDVDIFFLPLYLEPCPIDEFQGQVLLQTVDRGCSPEASKVVHCHCAKL